MRKAGVALQAVFKLAHVGGRCVVRLLYPLHEGGLNLRQTLCQHRCISGFALQRCGSLGLYVITVVSG